MSGVIKTVRYGRLQMIPANEIERIATEGVGAHTWQAAACAGMSIGQKGMVVAAKAMALTAADLFGNQQLVSDAKADFEKQLKGKRYESMIPKDEKPPVDYRGN